MDRNEILKSSQYFNDLTFRHLTVCLNEHERKSNLSFLIMASVFTEALLKDIHLTLAFELPDGELYTLIKNLKSKTKKCNDLDQKERIRLINIADRCDEIRGKRNRLVHDTGAERDGLDTETADVYKNLMFIVEAYLKSTVAARFKAGKTKDGCMTDNSSFASDFRVFISTITPHTVEQKVFLNGIDDEFRKLGIEPVRCKFVDYDKRDPIAKVRKTIEACNAVLVIGLERSHSYMFRDREFSEKQEDGLHRKHTSGWLHLEAGIANALNKKIFVMCHKDIFGDGIFDRDWNSYTVVEFPSPLDVNHEKVQLTLQMIKDYAEACSAG